MNILIITSLFHHHLFQDINLKLKNIKTDRFLSVFLLNIVYFLKIDSSLITPLFLNFLTTLNTDAIEELVKIAILLSVILL
jgi:hypothetical protein